MFRAIRVRVLFLPVQNIHIPIHSKECGAEQEELRYKEKDRVVYVARGRKEESKECEHYRHHPRGKS